MLLNTKLFVMETILITIAVAGAVLGAGLLLRRVQLACRAALWRSSPSNEGQVADEPTDFLPDDLTSEDNIALVRMLNPADSTGRALAVRCGREVRASMGRPRMSGANYTLATQRCNAWLDVHVPSLRRAHRDKLLSRAVYFALTPSPSERKLVHDLLSPETQELVREVHSGHVVPRYRYFEGLQRFLGITEVNSLDF